MSQHYFKTISKLYQHYLKIIPKWSQNDPNAPLWQCANCGNALISPFGMGEKSGFATPQLFSPMSKRKFIIKPSFLAPKCMRLCLPTCFLTCRTRFWGRRTAKSLKTIKKRLKTGRNSIRQRIFFIFPKKSTCILTFWKAKIAS